MTSEPHPLSGSAAVTSFESPSRLLGSKEDPTDGEDDSLDHVWGICARSIQHPERPPLPNFTRARLLIGGWLLRPIRGLPGWTRAVYVAQLDLGGRIPGWLANKLSQSQPLCVAAVAAYFRELEQTRKRQQQQQQHQHNQVGGQQRRMSVSTSMSSPSVRRA